ncbi:MAG: YicC family protein [Planctomycetota bacterium]|nr:YicC family protein [Planctomycetota bacterium]
MANTLKSMTGFGRATYTDGQISLEVEIRSVNNRFIKIQSRIPDRLSAFQAELEALIRGSIRRGSVSLTIRTEFPPEASAARLQPEVLKRYHDMAKEAKKKFSLPGEITIETLFGLPGVLEPMRDPSPADRSIWKRLEKPAKGALAGLIRMRVKEGQEIARDIQRRAKRIRTLTNKIEARAPRAMQEYARRLRKRIRSLLDGTAKAVASDDLAREIALVAERCDISEEIQRTKSHLGQMATCLSKEGEGRRLEFLVQELFREASTMAAKNIDGPAAAMILDLRSEIDKIKEQAQNIE